MTEPTPDSTIRAPWTSEQVATLNAFQERGSMHPFTCGNNDHGVSVVLMAHRDGWHCSDPACGYRQDWAHAFMADPEAWPRFPFGERHGPTPLRAELTPMQLLAAHPDVPLPPADRAGLRDRIAEALADIDGWGWVPGFDKNQSPTYQRYLERADVVLAVLPQPVDRAAVLTEAERQFLAHALDLAQDEMHSRPDEFGPEDEAAMERLRRMADEAQQQPDTEPTPPCTCADGGDCFAPAGHYADCPQADQPAVVSQPGKDTTQTQQDEAQEAPPVEPHPTPADLDAALTILDSVHGQDTTAPAAEAQQDGAQQDGARRDR